MKLFMTAVPLFTSDMSVGAYNLNYQNSDRLFGMNDNYSALDGAMQSPGLELLDIIGIEPFTGGKPICVPINKFQLLSDCALNCNVKPEQLILILSKDLPIEDIYMQKCEMLKDAGYSLAISGIEYSLESAKIYNLSEYVIMDTSDKYYLDKLKIIRIKYPYIKFILTKIRDISFFDNMKMITNSFYEGEFYSQPIAKDSKDISPLKANALNLLRIVGDEDFDLDKVSKVIQQDASLSISLLKFINSPSIGIRNKVASIKNAIALLGQKETRKWIMTYVSINMAEDKPNEITKLSLTRAKFAENLATAFEMGIHSPSLFLMGLFSLLDVILDLPMDKAINEISVNDKVKEALVYGNGDFYDILKLIYAYERADWHTVSHIMILKNIDATKLNQAFLDSLIWYRNLLSGLDDVTE